MARSARPAAAKAPGPLRAFFIRTRARRGHQIAAVAVARKLATLCWHMLTKEEDYLWAEPSLVAHKRRAMELAAGQPQEKGNRRGVSYENFVAAWRTRNPGKGRGCATASNRQGLNRLPGDACSRHATLRPDVDRTVKE
jgi:transposase